MRYWWLLLIKEQDVFQTPEGLLPPDLALALHLAASYLVTPSRLC